MSKMRKEFIAYLNGAKRSYIAFEQRENISHERERVYRQNDRHPDYTVFINDEMSKLNLIQRSSGYV